MKHIAALLTVCCLSLSCLGVDDELKGVITSVQNSSGENEAGEDVELLIINTHQVGEKFPGVVRIFIELTDTDGTVVWGQGQDRSQSGEVKGGNRKGMTYSGAVRWVFEVKHGELKRPKVTGYVVEYGYGQGKDFVCLAEKCYRTESKDEITARNKKVESLAIQCTSKAKQVDR